jgi:hypothetical protein
MYMKNLRKLSILLLACLLFSCKKDENTINAEIAYSMLSDKTWFLDYKQTGSETKNYVGQSTYFINFLNDRTTKDSDGTKGSFSIVASNGQLQISVNATSINGNPLVYIYQIESIGANNLILSFLENGQTTKMYYSLKK